MCGNWISYRFEKLFKWCHNTTKLEELEFCSKILNSYVEFQEYVLFGERPLSVYQFTKSQTSYPTPRHHDNLVYIEKAIKRMFANMKNLTFLNDKQKQAYCHYYMLGVVKELAEEEASNIYSPEEYATLIDYLLKITHTGHIFFRLRLKK